MNTNGTFNNGLSSLEPEENQSPLGIDVKRILYRALRYWYVVILSVAVALSIAYLRNRYATRVYTVGASIIILEKEETTGGEFIYKNALIDAYRNYLNEPYILKSHPLIERAVRKLNFENSFLNEGKILTSQLYQGFPLEAITVSSDDDYHRLLFRVTNLDTFEVAPYSESDAVYKPFRFRDTVEVDGFRFYINVLTKSYLDTYFNQTFILSHTPAQDVAASYSGRLSAVWAEEGSGVLNLSINGPIPMKEIDFLNGLIQEYQASDLNKKNRTATRTIEFITTQLGSLSDSLSRVEQQMQRFKSGTSVSDVGVQATRLYNQLEDALREKEMINLSESYFQYLLSQTQIEHLEDNLVLPSAVGLSDAILADLVKQVISLETELKLFQEGAKQETPIVSMKRKELTEVKSVINKLIESQRGTNKIAKERLDRQITALESQLSYLPVTEREYAAIKRRYSVLESLYIFLLQKRSEASISRASNSSDILVVNPPSRSGGFISPKPNQNYLIGMIVGLLIPFVAFVLMEVFNNRVQSREDVERVIPLPFIGGIGHKADEDNLVVHRKPKSAVAEAFRALRSNLNFFTGNKDKKVIMITSSVSGEGKSFTTINLGSVFAMSGKKTIIVGADMRKPRIFADLGLTNTTGLSSYLSGLVGLQDVIQSSSIDNLSFISGGPVPPNPSELLLQPRTGEMFEELLKVYDYVLLDTPPVALVTDAFILSKYADHTLYLVRQNYTPKGSLFVVRDYYHDKRLQNVSFLLNDIFKSGLGYGYGYSYTYSYGYGGYGYGYGEGKKGKDSGYYED